MTDNRAYEQSEQVEIQNKQETETVDDALDDTEKEDANKEADLMYKIDDVPPWYTCCILGLQHYLTMFGATVSIPFIICPLLCIRNDDPARGYIISTIFFVSGLVTMLQVTFGCRLPIIQGGTFSFLVPTMAILSLPQYQSNPDPEVKDNCPPGLMDGNGSEYSDEEKLLFWQVRIREVQGAICIASLFQVFIGFTGIMGLVLRWITPLTITPAVAMIGLSLFEAASINAEKNWGIAIMTILVMTICSQYLRNFKLPLLNVQVFKLFPILITILIMWGLCAILTVSGAFSKDNGARTDTNIKILEKADWFRFPYPFQWGVPTVSAAGVFGMLAGVLASAIESVGDYYACARLSGAPPPPVHAINRGIGMEGLGCILAGLWGTGNGTTSYSENIGAIGVTKVGSRRVVQWGALVMIIFGLFSKFGTFFLTIPQPIVGGIFCVMFGMITAVGLSNLQFVNLNSTRNLFILGFSIFFSLVLPQWIKTHRDLTLTGVNELDQIIKVLLETSMFVGGFLGFFLDNTIPGTPEERGLIAWQAQHDLSGENAKKYAGVSLRTYDIPFITKYLENNQWAKYVPFFPTFAFTAKGKSKIKSKNIV